MLSSAVKLSVRIASPGDRLTLAEDHPMAAELSASLRRYPPVLPARVLSGFATPFHRCASSREAIFR